MKNKSLKILTMVMAVIILGSTFPAYVAAAKEEVVNFEISKDPAENGRTLCALLEGNSKRKIVFPEKGKVHIDRVLWVGNNKTIEANDCTIIQDGDTKPIICNAFKKTNYKSLKNLKITGGTWKTKTHNENISFRFLHAYNIKIKDAVIPTHLNGHAIELIACKKVVFDGCTCKAIKKHGYDTSLEEAIQIDVATKRTAPSIYTEYGKKAVNGAACENITVKNCTVKSSRGVCANRNVDDAYKKIKMHKNIKIIDNTITGTTSEALVLHNTVGYTVTGNKIVTENKRYSTPYSNGFNVELFGKSSTTKKYKNTISKNKIYGGKCCIHIATNTSSKYGKTTVSKNKLYCRYGAKYTMSLSAGKFVVKGNKSYKW